MAMAMAMVEEQSKRREVWSMYAEGSHQKTKVYSHIQSFCPFLEEGVFYVFFQSKWKFVDIISLLFVRLLYSFVTKL